MCPSILISSAINTHLSAISSYKHWATQPSQPRTWLDKMPTLLGNLHLTLAICMKHHEASTAMVGTNVQSSFPMSLFHTFLFMFLAEHTKRTNLDQLIYIIHFHLWSDPAWPDWPHSSLPAGIEEDVPGSLDAIIQSCEAVRLRCKCGL